MPFHPHHHQNQQPGIGQGLQQAGSALGSIGAPALRAATGTTSAGTDVLISSNQAAQSQQQSQQGNQPQQSQPFNAHPPGDYSTQSTPGIGLQQHSSMSTSIPGSLQPGGAGRPAAPQSAYTAPTVPTVPHINTNAQQYTLPTRSNTMNSASHSYSRSSPAANLDQKYIPFSNHPESQIYPQTPQQKFFTPQTPTDGVSNSPLALEQIRPRANSNMVEDAMSGTTFGEMMDRAPTNSNYLAPWPAFAFDWCKYPVPHGSSAGKMAIGSYTEEPHNFVRQS